ncbi:histidine phosphatase family protein [Leifsonia poae]|uniref:histidine phosphatase family protein n=1 Tax=Leifsonia poae TaxID=110933 RepID=UPI003D66E9C8
MVASKLILVRHGESTANVAATAAVAAGLETIVMEARDADVSLSPLGELQARTLGPRLFADLDGGLEAARVFSSPYRRSVQTARFALGDALPFAIDERLRDRELGIVDSLTARGIAARLPAEAERRRWVGKFYYRPPGGEAWTDVALRIRSFCRDVDWTDPRPVVVFAHDAVVSLFLYVLLHYTEQELKEFLRTRVVTNASVTILEHDGTGTWEVGMFSDDRHLREAGMPLSAPGAAASREPAPATPPR